MSENNIQKGTIKNRAGEKKDLILGVLSKDMLIFVLAAIAILHWGNIITIPYVSDVAIPFADIFKIIILSVILVYFAAWDRLKRMIDKIYEKDWAYLMFSDALGEVTGVWKTDPETLSEFEDYVDYIGDGSPTYRDGIDVHGRRYLLVKDMKLDKDKEQWLIEHIDDYPVTADDDQIIANKDLVVSVFNEMEEDAKFGRRARISLKPRLKHYMGKMIAQFTVYYEHASDSGIIDPQELYEESIQGFERLDIESDDMGKSLIDEKVEQITENIDIDEEQSND